MITPHILRTLRDVCALAPWTKCADNLGRFERGTWFCDEGWIALEIENWYFVSDSKLGLSNDAITQGQRLEYPADWQAIDGASEIEIARFTKEIELWRLGDDADTNLDQPHWTAATSGSLTPLALLLARFETPPDILQRDWQRQLGNPPKRRSPLTFLVSPTGLLCPIARELSPSLSSENRSRLERDLSSQHFPHFFPWPWEIDCVAPRSIAAPPLLPSASLPLAPLLTSIAMPSNDRSAPLFAVDHSPTHPKQRSAAHPNATHSNATHRKRSQRSSPRHIVRNHPVSSFLVLTLCILAPIGLAIYWPSPQKSPTKNLAKQKSAGEEMSGKESAEQAVASDEPDQKSPLRSDVLPSAESEIETVGEPDLTADLTAEAVELVAPSVAAEELLTSIEAPLERAPKLEQAPPSLHPVEPSLDIDKPSLPAESSLVERAFRLKNAVTRTIVPIGENVQISKAVCQVTLAFGDELEGKQAEGEQVNDAPTYQLEPEATQRIVGKGRQVWTLRHWENEAELLLGIESDPSRSWGLVIRVGARFRAGESLVLVSPAIAQEKVLGLEQLGRKVEQSLAQLEAMREGRIPRGRVNITESRRQFNAQAKELETALESWRAVSELCDVAFGKLELRMSFREE